GALRVTYAFVLLVTVGTLGPYALLQGTGGGAAMLASWVRGLSPIPAVLEVLGQGDVGSQGLTTGAALTLRYLVLGTASSVACMHVTVARLNHRLLERVRPAGVMTEDRPAGILLLRRLLFLVDPQRRSGLIGPWVNPVMVKEFRCRRFGRSHWMLRL